MEINKSYIGKYFKKSVVHLFKSHILFFVISFIEFFELLICLINYEETFFYMNKNFFETRTFLKNILLQLLPYNYYITFQTQANGKGFDRNYIFLIIYFILILLFYLYLFFGTKEEQNEKNMKKIFNKICINFFDFILFRLAVLYGFDSISRVIFKISAKKEYKIFDIFIQFILICFYFIAFFTHIYYFRNVCIWNNFKIVHSYINLYPYDKYFSLKYDIILFILKVLITLSQNYLEYNNNILNIIFIFLAFIFMVIFYCFALFTFYLIFFSKNALYIYMNFSNKLRIFFIFVIFECLLLRLFLHSSGDHIPYLVYTFILIIFDIYLVTTKFNEYLYTSANTSQNFLGVCWFVQSNNIDNQDFIIEWISNHKRKCLLDSSDCPICSKLKIDFDIYSDEHLLELKKERIENQFLNTNDKNKNKNEIIKIEKRTLISNMFPPFKFFTYLIILSERNKKYMSKKDKIRLDFIKLTTLFYNEEKDIDFIIFNKNCHCLLKYKKNSQVLMTFILIFDLLRKSDKFMNQKYEILQKNEELRNSLTIYLKEYEEFIFYKEKSPLNYYDISIKYKSFKDLLITIHMYFKKNIECNYELILMRYIYETLINSKFYNIQPFDLNNYSEFLEFHFTNSKTFLLKYNIEQNLFFVVKASKEILKYQGKQFGLIFPSELRKVALDKFLSQLNDIEEKNSKHIFEFIIDSNVKHLGFIESFKMNYVIYPTNLINELFIQSNYRISYNNLIIFENMNNYGESLYSFSSQLYKIFGLTPQDIFLLYNYGIPIFFENIFIKKKNIKENNKDEKTKMEYIFKYKIYYSILEKLLSYDIIKESQNYSQIKEKEKQFEILSKEDKEIIFQINKKWECYTETKKFIIYSIKEVKKRKLKKNLGEKELKPRSTTYSQFNEEEEINGLEGEESENEDEDNDFDYGEDLFEGKGMTMAGSILSSLSLTKTSDSMESSRKNGKKDEKAEEKKKKQQQLYKTIYIILGFGIVLIIISIIFLIMENTQTTKFKHIIQLFHTFHIFKRGIERMPLTILSNFKYQIDDLKTNNLFEDYSKNLGKKYNLLSKVNLNEILMKDSQLKLPFIIESYNAYQKELHSLEEGLSTLINNLQGKSYKLTVDGDKLFFYKLDLSLISIAREYLNVLSVLLQNNSFTETYFYLMSTGDLVGNLRTIYRSTTEEVTMLTKNMILLLFTYPFLHNGLTTIATFILDQAKSVVAKITNIYIIFYAALLILHLILGLIGIMFLMSFIKILKLIIINGNRLFEDKRFLEFQEKRLNQIKIMKNLYSENPIKIMDKIELIDDMYKNKNNEDLKKKTNDTQILEYDKNYIKEEEKEKNLENDLLSKSNSQKSSMNNNKKTYSNIMNASFGGKLKTMVTEPDKNINNNNNIDKEELNSINISTNINKKVSSINKRLKFKQFHSIIMVEFILLFIFFALYFIYSIIMLILIIFGIQRLYYLVDYINCNDLLDGYLYDNINVLIYMIETNSSSYYYGSLLDSSVHIDYIKQNIDLLYDAITTKEDIEQYKEDKFLPLNQIINLNCSFKIIPDEYFINITNDYNISYDDYFGEICKEFPVASTGMPTTMFYEIIYIVEHIYNTYKELDNFYQIFEHNLNQTKVYKLFALTLTFLRIQRNYFYNDVIMKEVNELMDYFSLLILIYLVICIIFEVVIFLVIYCGIIRKVRKKDNLFGNFIDSFKYD